MKDKKKAKVISFNPKYKTKGKKGESAKALAARHYNTKVKPLNDKGDILL